MKRTSLQNELNLLDRCMEYLSSKLLPHGGDIENVSELETRIEKIGARITGDLTLPKWKAACQAELSA